MAHPFQDKLIVFIGLPKRCSRQAARDAVINANGIPDERITVFTDYVVAFERAEGTMMYKKQKSILTTGFCSCSRKNSSLILLKVKLFHLKNRNSAKMSSLFSPLIPKPMNAKWSKRKKIR